MPTLIVRGMRALFSWLEYSTTTSDLREVGALQPVGSEREGRAAGVEQLLVRLEVQDATAVAVLAAIPGVSTYLNSRTDQSLTPGMNQPWMRCRPDPVRLGGPRSGTNPRAVARAVGAIGTGRRGSTPRGGMAAQSCMARRRVSRR